MSASQEARKELSKAIKEKIQNSKSVVFVSSIGLTVAEDTELRNEIRKNDVEYKVYKNTLIRYALHDLGITDFDNDLNGPTSVAFGSDEVGAAKLMVEASKKYADKITVKSGYISDSYCDANSVKKYASIPGNARWNSLQLYERTCSCY